MNIFFLFYFPGTPESQLLSEKRRLGLLGEGKLRLYLKAPNSSMEIPLEGNNTIFSYVQQLNITLNGSTKSDVLKKLWEPTYTWVIVTFQWNNCYVDSWYLFYRIVYSDNRSAESETKVCEFMFLYLVRFEVDAIAGIFAQKTKGLVLLHSIMSLR